MKKFSWFFIVFFKSKSNSEFVEKKDESHSLSFSEISDSEKVAT